MLFAGFCKFSVSNKNVLYCCYNPISSLFNLECLQFRNIWEQKFKLLPSQHTLSRLDHGVPLPVFNSSYAFFPPWYPVKSAFNSVNFSLLFVNGCIFYIYIRLCILYILQIHIFQLCIFIWEIK